MCEKMIATIFIRAVTLAAITEFQFRIGNIGSSADCALVAHKLSRSRLHRYATLARMCRCFTVWALLDSTLVSNFSLDLLWRNPP